MRVVKPIMQEQKQSLQISTYCPQTGYPVFGLDRTHFALPGGQFTWWQCPYCQARHAAIVDVFKIAEPIFSRSQHPE